jgi:nicotinamidase-related amidase
MRGLMVIDVQQAMFAGAGPFDSDAVMTRIAGLMARARAAKVPLFFVQHDGGPGDDFAAGSPDFPFHPSVAPLPGEPVTIKRKNSGFYRTGLDATLKAAGIDDLVICGMQTEYCVDATVRSAFERDYHVTVASGAHTTFDGPILKAPTIIAYTENIWHGRYATVTPADAIVFA